MSNAIVVGVRVRPFNAREIKYGSRCVILMEGNVTKLIIVRQGKMTFETPKEFVFDFAFWTHSKEETKTTYASQEFVFESLGRQILTNIFEGFNSCLFAYGQTGSGKTYTMTGIPSDPGIVPRIGKEMFELASENAASRSVATVVECSFCEIYNEEVHDLLEEVELGEAMTPLAIRQHPKLGVFIQGIRKIIIKNANDFLEIVTRALNARATASTNMNSTSSRSHALAIVTMTQTDPGGTQKCGTMTLVDLAGSERVGSTGATGSVAVEGQNINLSLTTLGMCLSRLADHAEGKSKNLPIPYRDSALTYLLSNSLGGNSKTAMIANVSPADLNYDETLSTLRFASVTKRVKTVATVNESATSLLIRQLREELAALKKKYADLIVQPKSKYEATTATEQSHHEQASADLEVAPHDVERPKNASEKLEVPSREAESAEHKPEKREKYASDELDVAPREAESEERKPEKDQESMEVAPCEAESTEHNLEKHAESVEATRKDETEERKPEKEQESLEAGPREHASEGCKPEKGQQSLENASDKLEVALRAEHKPWKCQEFVEAAARKAESEHESEECKPENGQESLKNASHKPEKCQESVEAAPRKDETEERKPEKEQESLEAGPREAESTEHNLEKHAESVEAATWKDETEERKPEKEQESLEAGPREHASEGCKPEKGQQSLENASDKLEVAPRAEHKPWKCQEFVEAAARKAESEHESEECKPESASHKPEKCQESVEAAPRKDETEERKPEKEQESLEAGPREAESTEHNLEKHAESVEAATWKDETEERKPEKEQESLEAGPREHASEGCKPEKGQQSLKNASDKLEVAPRAEHKPWKCQEFVEAAARKAESDHESEECKPENGQESVEAATRKDETEERKPEKDQESMEAGPLKAESEERKPEKERESVEVAPREAESAEHNLEKHAECLEAAARKDESEERKPEKREKHASDELDVAPREAESTEDNLEKRAESLQAGTRKAESEHASGERKPEKGQQSLKNASHKPEKCQESVEAAPRKDDSAEHKPEKRAEPLEAAPRDESEERKPEKSQESLEREVPPCERQNAEESAGVNEKSLLQNAAECDLQEDAVSEEDAQECFDVHRDARSVVLEHENDKIADEKLSRSRVVPKLCLSSVAVNAMSCPVPRDTSDLDSDLSSPSNDDQVSGVVVAAPEKEGDLEFECFPDADADDRRRALLAAIEDQERLLRDFEDANCGTLCTAQTSSDYLAAINDNSKKSGVFVDWKAPQLINLMPDNTDVALASVVHEGINNFSFEGVPFTVEYDGLLNRALLRAEGGAGNEIFHNGLMLDDEDGTVLRHGDRIVCRNSAFRFAHVGGTADFNKFPSSIAHCELLERHARISIWVDRSHDAVAIGKAFYMSRPPDCTQPTLPFEETVLQAPVSPRAMHPVLAAVSDDLAAFNTTLFRLEAELAQDYPPTVAEETTKSSDITYDVVISEKRQYLGEKDKTIRSLQALLQQTAHSDISQPPLHAQEAEGPTHQQEPPADPEMNGDVQSSIEESVAMTSMKEELQWHLHVKHARTFRSSGPADDSDKALWEKLLQDPPFLSDPSLRIERVASVYVKDPQSAEVSFASRFVACSRRFAFVFRKNDGRERVMTALYLIGCEITSTSEADSQGHYVVEMLPACPRHTADVSISATAARLLIGFLSEDEAILWKCWLESLALPEMPLPLRKRWVRENITAEPLDASPAALRATAHRRNWRPDSSVTGCQGCGSKFSLFHRRHHCRMCGEIFCSDCLNTEKLCQSCVSQRRGNSFVDAALHRSWHTVVPWTAVPHSECLEERLVVQAVVGNQTMQDVVVMLDHYNERVHEWTGSDISRIERHADDALRLTLHMTRHREDVTLIFGSARDQLHCLESLLMICGTRMYIVGVDVHHTVEELEIVVSNGTKDCLLSVTCLLATDVKVWIGCEDGRCPPFDRLFGLFLLWGRMETWTNDTLRRNRLTLIARVDQPSDHLSGGLTLPSLFIIASETWKSKIWGVRGFVVAEHVAAALQVLDSTMLIVAPRTKSNEESNFYDLESDVRPGCLPDLSEAEFGILGADKILQHDYLVAIDCPPLCGFHDAMGSPLVQLRCNSVLEASVPLSGRSACEVEFPVANPHFSKCSASPQPGYPLVSLVRVRIVDKDGKGTTLDPSTCELWGNFTFDRLAFGDLTSLMVANPLPEFIGIKNLIVIVHDYGTAVFPLAQCSAEGDFTVHAEVWKGTTTTGASVDVTVSVHWVDKQ